METTKYIAFLRGINIGNHRIKMERMRELFAELGLTHVRSYIQTGNIFFETTENDRNDLTRKIENHLRAALGYEVPTFLRTIAEIENALTLEPFKNIEATGDVRFIIIFTSQPLPQNFELPYSSPKNDYEILQATTGEAFAIAKIVKGAPSNPALIIERICKVKTTSRFYATTEKILLAAKLD